MADDKNEQHQLPGQGDEQITEQPEANADDLVVTNSGVDLSASDLPEDPKPKATKSQAKKQKLTVAEEAQQAADPTPLQEAVAAGSNVKSPVGNPTPLQTGAKGMPIDASGLAVTTNQDVIDNFPRNENGQVEIDEAGRIVGLNDEQQPLPGNADPRG